MNAAETDTVVETSDANYLKAGSDGYIAVFWYDRGALVVRPWCRGWDVPIETLRARVVAAIGVLR